MQTFQENGIALHAVDRVPTISRSDFQSRYLKPEIPLVIETLTDSWPAKRKWTPEFFLRHHGHRQVKVYDASFATPGATYMSSVRTIPLREYIDQVIHHDGDLRMFLYNLLASSIVDRGMNKLFSRRWFRWKEARAAELVESSTDRDWRGDARAEEHEDCCTGGPPQRPFPCRPASQADRRVLQQGDE
jgi:hypothetical protein